jgi:predicted dehydrogenase/threonine dehydrogenase-like Zn-dependent dehydrogenase
MQQLTQQLKSGHMEILEVPFPALNKGQVLIRNHYSVISSGTEGKTVSDARKGYIAKARSRKKEVQQVVELIKIQGFKETYKMVMNKLDAPAALGYSSSGEVIAVAEDVQEFSVGDLVACGGASASHADVISVPKNLCVKIAESDSLKAASFTTLAAIAMQGIRQADMKLGETAVIIGLGLIGQLTIVLLKAAGIKVIGVDIDESKLEISLKSGASKAYLRDTPGIENIIKEQASGQGVDAVLITAASSSTDPVNFAGEVCRQKGKVVVVGAVPTGFERKNYYRKEIDLRMSCSYGPGRYDSTYEDKGIDYPFGLVRWTEKRNMQAFVDLLDSKSITIDHLISHEFDLENAKKAYELIVAKDSSVNGIVLKYSNKEELNEKVEFYAGEPSEITPNVGFIGAGSFAQNMLLPRMKGIYNFVGVATARGNTSRYVGDKYKFNYATNDADELIHNNKINTVFITTRHNLHAPFILKALDAQKHIFVEKPLCLTKQELLEIKQKYTAISHSGVQLMLGFNRRFSALTERVLNTFDVGSPKSILIRVNAGAVPPEHWIHDPEVGGGRIIGEACHFIDLATYFANSRITRVYANQIKKAEQNSDTVNINLDFENGSTAQIAYYSNGSKLVPKEYIEVYSAGNTAVIDNFKVLRLFTHKGKKKIKLKEQDKGHQRQLMSFAASLSSGSKSPIPIEQIFHSTEATFAVIDSLKEKRIVALNE